MKPAKAKVSKNDPLPTPIRKKTFTGCWTCRNRKVKCDLGKPECNQCLKRKIPCEGYDIKLRWSTRGDKDDSEEYFQRRNIDFVVYPPGMTFETYEDMDVTLAKLHSPSFNANETKVLGPFGVFQGLKIVPKKSRISKRKRKDGTCKDSKASSSPCLTPSNSSLYPTRKSTPEISLIDLTKTPENMGPNTVLNSLESTNNTLSASSVSDTLPPFPNLLPSVIENALQLNSNPEKLSSQQSEILSTIDNSLFDNFGANNDNNKTSMPVNSNISPGNISSDQNKICSSQKTANVIEFESFPKDQSNSVTSSSKDLNSNNNKAQNLNSNTYIINNADSMRNTLQNSSFDTLLSQFHPANLQSSSLVHNKSSDTNNLFNNNLLTDSHNNIITNNIITNSIQQDPSLSLSSLNDLGITSSLSSGLDNFNTSFNDSHVHSSNRSINSINDVNQHVNYQHENLDASGKIYISGNTSITNIDSNNYINSTSLRNTSNLSNLSQSEKHLSSDNNSYESDGDNDLSPVMISTNSLINKYLSSDMNYGLPTNTIYFSPEARQLLHHYIHQVSRLMTVVTHDSTPWKTIYLPRAINAIGCLTALGVASPARSTILHALLAVSSYHLASKYPEHSDNRKHFTMFGSRLKMYALKYLKQCPSRPSVESLHKDITTAVLSMVTIDVVSGEMESCSQHLNSCKELIMSQVKNSQMAESKETQILHRIYAFLNLLQDSTNITTDRLDSSVLDDSEWDYIREMKDLGLESPLDGTPMVSPSTITSGSPDVNNPSDSDKSRVTNSDSPKTSIPVISPATASSIFGEFEFFGNECADVAWLWENNAASPSASTMLNSTLSTSNSTNKIFLSASQPVKNYYDAEIVSTYAMYGIPDSLTILFNRVVRLARQRCYINAVGDAPPKLLKAFNSKCARMDELLLEWLTRFQEDQIPPEFTADSKMAFYLHTIAFYHSVWIYHCTIVKDVPSETLQDKVKFVLRYLQNMLQLNRDRPSPVIVPLLFPAFIAACETVDNSLAQEFEIWFNQMTIDGLGTYHQARKVVNEVWKRRRMGLPKHRWYEVMQEWNINLLLS
ncbi:uncharacterized protein SAPINGB_P003640 [Magnusiomyces paraingens]|uniref:Zn(2)-C6 fungal-type domain-containing protein n=1 Tax=Magnusiomyces paraingens TaxID=2606893 RepID=A0A5E8BSN5_9ASCO|nr:uncharacterized protein SAPINGB_P003640 [Saprochaete ingens]VVT53569.1 unnamed protein product [Saprochaete ingens]